MYKLLLLLLCAVLCLGEPGTAMAESEASVAITEGAVAARPIPRPNYKRYKGRKKHRKPGLFRRWAARRKAKRKVKTESSRRGVITVDPPTRNQ
ncbi:hypothetical protein [Hymenobacter chitinivorans]|uniref:Uncharacterized protein n=1 Tax=Hymenobacter chitinivorans DSM 11115 TaxID=1121954 RepID=A0A2M9ARK2_9BACT|nr:hypothetical protein [Hymenobacter chitinivorans]PJJ48319.1 hypothetical protein CLV45_4021 [Hymenobacter chitinivorans DSM 11115]